MSSSTQGWVVGDHGDNIWNVQRRIYKALRRIKGVPPNATRAHPGISSVSAVFELHPNDTGRPGPGYMIVRFYDGSQQRQMYVMFDSPYSDHRFTGGPAMLLSLGDDERGPDLIQRMLGEWPEYLRWFVTTTLLDDNVEPIRPRQGKYDFSLEGLSSFPPISTRHEQGWDVYPDETNNLWRVCDWCQHTNGIVHHNCNVTGEAAARQAGVLSNGFGMLMDRDEKILPINDQVTQWINYEPTNGSA
jgi:hypothetical protein